MFEGFFRLGPDWFGQYKKTRRITNGGMAVLFEGEDSSNEKRIIIKILEPSKIKQKKGTLWEGEIAKGLRHPNIVATYDCGTKRGRQYIVMEQLKGPTLKTLSTARDPWLDGRRLELLKGIAEGLAYVHRKKLIHRDLNSRNVMFRNDTPVIIDFGLTISSFDRVKQSADRRGTPSYMAPELILKNQVDHRTDIYALGVVMYEVATGRLPFPGDDIFDRMQKNVSLNPMAPSELAPGMSRAVDTLVMRALEKDPKMRFQNMDEVLEHLSYLKKNDFER